MTNFERFMKKNKVVKENVKYVATKSLVDENGEPLEWEIRPVSTKENDALRDSCTTEVLAKNKIFRPKLDGSKYTTKLICASVVEPNLNNKDLQDSYGVMNAEELLKEMVSEPGEYADFNTFVTQFNGFNVSLDETVETAKN